MPGDDVRRCIGSNQVPRPVHLVRRPEHGARCGRRRHAHDRKAGREVARDDRVLVAGLSHRRRVEEHDRHVIADAQRRQGATHPATAHRPRGRIDRQRQDQRLEAWAQVRDVRRQLVKARAWGQLRQERLDGTGHRWAIGKANTREYPQHGEGNQRGREQPPRLARHPWPVCRVVVQ